MALEARGAAAAARARTKLSSGLNTTATFPARASPADRGEAAVKRFLEAMEDGMERYAGTYRVLASGFPDPVDPAGQDRCLPCRVLLRRIDVVAHVGTLDPTDRAVANRASLEAFCLSVSHDPEAWSGIARIGGAPVWTLSRPGGLWLEANSLDDAQEAAIADWGLASGHAEKAALWKVWRFDDEADSWGVMVFDDHGRALDELHEDLDEDSDGPDGGPAIEGFEGLRLTPSGMARLERWVDPCHAMDGLVILWASEVLAPANPDVVGIWWDDIDDPLSLSCPRGGILPARLPEFSRSPGWTPEDEDPTP